MQTIEDGKTGVQHKIEEKLEDGDLEFSKAKHCSFSTANRRC